MIIFPAIDIRGGRCVRLLQGDYNKETVYSDTPAKQALKWQAEGGQLLHLVDLDGAKAGSLVNIEAVKAICNTVDIPCELGGGVRSMEDAVKAFDAGISRIILGTVACEKPELVSEMLDAFGAEKIVIGIDAKDGNVAVRGWLRDSGLDAFELAEQFASMGIMRIIFTDISTDGMLTGPNCESMATLCDMLPSCQIIASGGVGSVEDVKSLKNLNRNNLEGVIVGKALYDRKVMLKDLLSA